MQRFPLLQVTCLLISSFTVLNAQNIWTKSQASKTNLKIVELPSLPSEFRLLDFEATLFSNVLNSKTSLQTCIDIPMPDGSEECFVVEEYSVISDDLKTQRPDIKTYRGQSMYNPKARFHLVQTANDIHLIGDSDQGTFFLDKVTQENKSFVMSYFDKDMILPPAQCEMKIHKESIYEENNITENKMTTISWGTELRKYRMAILFSSSHSANYGNVISDIIDRELEIVVDMNFVCERDMCITFDLADSPELIIYTDPATDPYMGSLGTITGIINDALGSENYEIGTAIYGSGGGVSYLGVTCGGAKAGSQCSNDHWTIVHEMGHNMGAGHMFNYCPGWGSNGMEPGAGNSIMSYGESGVCSDGHDVPNGRINYFHSRSVEQMHNVLFVNTDCAENIVTNNNPPVLTMPMGGFYIPKLTPFTLTGSATDPDGTSTFLYAWEQFDYGIGSPPSAPSAADPLFQMFPFSNSPSRTIPQIGSIINGYNFGEVLPDVSRTLSFRLSARDNNLLGSGITFDDMDFFVDGNSGPFEVSYPNENTAVWAEEQIATVTWDVANTDQIPVNSQLVDISLSIDGGFTYPIALAASVANDGAHDIIVPNSIGTNNRIKVASADNIFFDISDNDFEIVAAGTEDFLAFALEDNISTCDETSVTYPIEIFQIGSFNNTLELTVSGLPAGATSNAPMTIPSTGITNFTLSNLGTVSPGNYPLILTLTETSSSLVKTLNLNYLKKENLITLDPGKAMSFNGSGNVHISKNNSDFDFGQDKDFSVEFWTKTTTTSSDDAIISDKNWNSGGNPGWVIMIQNGSIGFNAGTGSGRVDIGSNTIINDGEWHHIAISLSRTVFGKVQIYVDGHLRNEKSLIALGDISTSTDIVIGADTYNNWAYNGEIDEVRIWKKALSAIEIRENMHLVTEVCDTDLISCYQFNEANGNALDAFSLHHGIVSNSTRVISSTPLGTGNSNSQIENSGIITFINTGFEANYINQIGANVTVTKIDLSPYGNIGVNASDIVFDSQYWVLNRYENTGDLNFDGTFFVNETITSQEANIPISLKLYGRNNNSDSEWNFLTYGSSANEANNSIVFENITTYGQYIISKDQSPVIALFESQLAFCNLANGSTSEVISYQTSAAFLTENMNITAPAGFQISTQPDADFGSSITLTPTSGAIAEVTIYVRFEPNAVGDFDALISHSSTGALLKTINVIGSSVQPQAYNSVVFDGSNNIHIPKSNSDLNFGDDKSFSIEFWTKTTTTSGDDAIISDKDWNSGGYPGWVIAMQSGQFVFNAGSGGNRVDIGSGGSIDYNDNEWHHVALSFDRIGNLSELYVDGFLKGSGNLNGLGNINTTLDLVIGADGINGYAYNGEIDDVRIWNKALTVMEVREAMHLIYTGCPTDLIASYHLDDVDGIVTDDVGILDGIMNNVVSIVSSAPIGPGTSNTQIESLGNVIFTGTNFAANYSQETNASITCSKLNVAPYGISGIDPTDIVLNSQYWILNDYENTGSLNFEATFQPSEDISPGFAADVFKLYGRNFNLDTDWTLITDISSVNTGTNEVSFPSVQQYGQYLIAKNSTVLPLELISFRGAKMAKSVLLDWTTTNEINVSGFEIQRKSEIGEFVRVGWVESISNSGFTAEYAFEDLTVSFDKNNYYRLKILDHDGEFAYSNVIIITGEREKFVELYPNPTNGMIFLNSNFNYSNLEVNLYNAKGQFLKKVSIQQNYHEIDLSDLTKGIYFYTIVGDKYTKNGKIVIK